MFQAELTEKQLALEKVRDLLRAHENSRQPPSKAFLLELSKYLSSLNKKYPDTKKSPLSKRAKLLLKELSLNNSGALERKIRRKENHQKRNKSKVEIILNTEPVKEKSEDLLDSRLLYKGSFGAGKRR
jgi:hypothetical protein